MRAINTSVNAEAYSAIYAALCTYARLDTADRAEVAEDYAELLSMISAYNATAEQVNADADAATELALAPLCCIGFSFLAALWLLIKRKF